MTILEKINSLLEERDKAWEERKKLLMQMKKAKSVAERDELFKKYIDYGYKIDEICNKLKFDDKNIEAEIWKNGITIKSKNKHFEVLIPFDVFEELRECFEKIVEWYRSLDVDGDA